MRDVWRRYWPLQLVSVGLLVVVVIFARYLEARQQTTDARAEKQRRAICAILANIPGQIPAEIATARRAFARPGHADDCMPIRRPHAALLPTPTATVTTTATPAIPTASKQPGRAHATPPAAGPTPRATPRPRPTRTPSASPTPQPTASCLLGVLCPPSTEVGPR